MVGKFLVASTGIVQDYSFHLFGIVDLLYYWTIVLVFHRALHIQWQCPYQRYYNKLPFSVGFLWYTVTSSSLNLLMYVVELGNRVNYPHNSDTSLYKISCLSGRDNLPSSPGQQCLFRQATVLLHAIYRCKHMSL